MGKVQPSSLVTWPRVYVPRGRLPALYLLCLRLSMRLSIMVIKSSSSSSGYFWRAYSRNSGHSAGTASAIAGAWPARERILDNGTPLYSDSFWQDRVLGILDPASQRITVAWLMYKSLAIWLGKRLRRRITSLRNDTKAGFFVVTVILYQAIYSCVNALCTRFRGLYPLSFLAVCLNGDVCHG